MSDIKDFVIEEGVLKAYNGGDENIVIPSEIAIIGDSAFAFNKKLVSVEIPNGVTIIGSSAFSGCDNLINVTIPSTLTTIEDDAFFACKNLYEIMLPEGVRTIGKNAFFACENLHNVVIPTSIEVVGADAFQGCDNLRYNVVEDAKYIGNINNPYVYLDGIASDGLKEVKIAEGCQIIATTAFQDCKELNHVEFPQSIISIGEYAFVRCSKLENITIADNVKFIGNCAFYACQKLKNITVSEKNSFYKAVDGILYSKDEKKVLIYPQGKTENSYVMPEGVISVENNAFDGCKNLKVIKFCNEIKSIGEKAFHGCSGLEYLEFPNNLTFIGARSFSWCTTLKEVLILGKNTIIADSNAFEGCNNLKKVTTYSWCEKGLEFKEGKTVLDLRAHSVGVIKNNKLKMMSILCYVGNRLDGIDYVENIIRENDDYIKKQRKKLYVEALKHSTLLRYMIEERMILLEDAVSILENAASKTGVAVKAMIMAYIDSFGDSTRENLAKKQAKETEKELSLDLNTSAGLKTLWNLKNNPDGTITLTSLKQQVETVIIPEKIGDKTVTALNDKCFYENKKLKEVTIANTVISIGKKAFYNCNNLVKITIPESVTIIGESAFLGCDRLSDVCITNLEKWCNITFVSRGSNPLAMAKKLYLNDEIVTNLTIPNSITAVEKAFTGCKSLINVFIGPQVTSISNDAFFGCSHLTNITVSDDNKYYMSIDGNVYSKEGKILYIYPNGKRDKEFVVPQCVECIDEYAFSACNYLKTLVIYDGVSSITDNAFLWCDKLVVSAPENSYAKTYAKKKKIKFKAL